MSADTSGRSHRQRLQIIFRKGEGARYLSHLDLMATLEFSIRRAGLPVELSEGFNPRPRFSLAVPLALGHVGEREILEIVLREPVAVGEVQVRLQASVPPGITIHSVQELPAQGKSAASRVRGAIYRLELPHPVPDLAGRVAALLARDHILTREERDGKVRHRDLRPFIAALESEGEDRLRLVVFLDQEGGVRPEQVLDLLGIDRDGVAVMREGIKVAP